jgi:hypothetical protein
LTIRDDLLLPLAGGRKLSGEFWSVGTRALYFSNESGDWLFY